MISGVQVSSLKPLLTTEEQVRAAFLRLHDMGCSAVQLQWIDRAVPIDTIAGALKEAGLNSVSVQDFYETIRQDKTYYIALNKAAGGTWMCVSRIPERLKSLCGLDEYIAELRAFQKELDGHGQKLCIHPVSADFEPIEGVDPVEYLMENMPELSVCADLYHLNKRGFDLPMWIRRYAGRIIMVHFKDEEDGQLVPAGQGSTDWQGVVQACMDAGIPYAFVEQETWDRDPFDCLREAVCWLKEQLRISL